MAVLRTCLVRLQEASAPTLFAHCSILEPEPEETGVRAFTVSVNSNRATVREKRWEMKKQLCCYSDAAVFAVECQSEPELPGARPNKS